MQTRTSGRTRHSSGLVAVLAVATLALMLVLNGRGGVHADALPFVTIEAPDEPFYNERFDFTLFFDNTDLNDPGYGPFIDLELPPALRYASGDAS